MFRPLALALCLSSPVTAECLPEGTKPTKATYNSGSVIEVLGYEGETLTYRQTIIENGKQVEMTVHAGIFTISALRGGEGAVFAWKTGLPALSELVAGASFAEEAMLTTPGLLPPRPFTTDLTIIGMEEITVAGCTYPALKMVVTNKEAGKDLGQTTKWVHLPSLLTLRSEVRQGDDMRLQEAVVVE